MDLENLIQFFYKKIKIELNPYFPLRNSNSNECGR